jgi:hypothetical protein
MSSGKQLDEAFLVDAIKFSRRMGNYLYFPVFLVCGLCAAAMLVVGEGHWVTRQERALFSVYAGLAIGGFVLWRLSRRPRATLFLVEGVLLAGLTAVWVSWFVFNVFAHFLQLWPSALFRSHWFLFVAVGMGAASLKCLRLWSHLRLIGDAPLESMLERIASLADVDKSRFEM